VVWIEAETSVDKTHRLVTINEIKVPKVNFPSAEAANDTYAEMFRQVFGAKGKGVTIALDRLEAEPAIKGEEEKGNSLPVKNEAPQIIFATSPTLLVYVDGGPAWRKVEGTKVERVLNTRPLILKDVDGKIYLHLYDGWMASASLQGPWS